jgi:hypothetical protein
MAARALPNLALMGFFDIGEDGWDDEMSLNLLKLSVLVQATALDKVAADPGSPADGDVYIFDETHATHPNEVAIRDDGAWVYVEPFDGWLIFNQAEGYYEKFDGTVWAELETGGGSGSGAITVSSETGNYTLEIGDANGYKLIDTSGGLATLTVPTNAAVAFPVGTRVYIEQDGANAITLAGDTGVTVESRGGVFDIAGDHGVAVLFKKATNTWTLTGDLE